MEYPDLVVDVNEHSLPDFESKWDAMRHAVAFAEELHKQGEKVLVTCGGPEHPATGEEETLLRSVGITTMVVGWCEVSEYHDAWRRIANAAQEMWIDTMFAREWIKAKGTFSWGEFKDFQEFYDYKNPFPWKKGSENETTNS